MKFRSEPTKTVHIFNRVHAAILLKAQSEGKHVRQMVDELLREMLKKELKKVED